MSATAMKSFINTGDYTEQVLREITCAPNTNVSYRPDLIRELKRSNRNILGWIKLLLAKIKSRDVKKSRQFLVEMKRTMVTHFIKENNAMLVYVKAVHQGHAFRDNLVKQMKAEMAGVQSMIFLFFNTYLNTRLTTDDMHAMGRELYVMGKVFFWRVKRLEALLYPLYVPPKLK